MFLRYKKTTCKKVSILADKKTFISGRLQNIFENRLYFQGNAVFHASGSIPKDISVTG
jgi:hypothetical protein